MANIFKAKTLLAKTGTFSDSISAPNIVYKTGDQTISGDKTFVGNVEIQGTGIFNNIDLTMSDYYFDGVDIDIINSNLNISGNVNVSGQIYISGNPVLTGIPDANWASQTELNSLSGNVVLLTGSQTIAGTKTFSNTGVFNTLSINDNKLTSYAYHTNNFTFSNYVNIINSTTGITGTLPNPIESGINYYVKNLNTGILLITGASNRLIDAYSFVNLYKNESLNIMGVNNIGYTGWVTLSLGGGVS